MATYVRSATQSWFGRSGTSLRQVGKDRPGVVAVGGDNVTASPLRLQPVLAHQAAELLAVHDYTLVAQSCADPPIAVALELVADRADPDEEFVRRAEQRRRS